MAMTITGINELYDKLYGLPIKTRKKMGKASLRAGAKLIQSAARTLSPDRTGTLERNIKVRAGKSKGDWISIKVGIQTRDTDPAFYATFVQLGTRKIATPNDFLKTAAMQNKDHIGDVVTDRLRELIESEARK